MKLVGTIPKKDILAILKTRKAPIKAIIAQKAIAKRLVEVLTKEVVVLGVVGRRTTSRTIRLL